MGDASDLFFFAGGHVLVAPAPEGRGVTLGFCQGKVARAEDLAPAQARQIGESLIRCAEAAQKKLAEAAP